MSNGRHSYVRFWPSDWLAGTARMSLIHRAIYHEICCYNWDKNEPCPPSDLAMIVMEAENGDTIVDQLVAAGKLQRDDRGVWSPRAMAEAQYAFDQWEKRSKGGKSYRPTEDKSKTVTKTVTKSGPTLIVSNNQNQNQNQNQNPKKETPPTPSRKAGWTGGDVLPDSWVEWARRDRGWSAAQVNGEAQRFIDDAIANGRTYASWERAWMKWCRSSYQKTVGSKQAALTL